MIYIIKSWKEKVIIINCIFCNLEKNKIENTILDEKNHFYILPTVGSLVDGYILVVSKRHINSMSELTKNEMDEYNFIIEKYRNIFRDIYGKYPIVFEHGSPVSDNSIRANSVIHAHSHIVNHAYLDEPKIIKRLNFKPIQRIEDIKSNENYIMYINNNFKYVTYNFEPISQLMRKLIAKDLKYEDKFDWKKEKFMDNIIKTILKVKEYNEKRK